MKLELKSENFTSLSSLVNKKEDLRRNNSEWEARQEILNDFYNGRPLASEQVGDEENLEELTNHLIGYANLKTIEKRYYGLWASSSKLIDVNVVDPEMDVQDRDTTSEFINKYLNKAMRLSTRFGAFWKSASGELALAGRAACTFKEDSDWCPKTLPKILLPDNVGTDASELTYGYAPREMTKAQLESLLEGKVEKETEEDKEDEEALDDVMEDSVEVNEEVVRSLIATVFDQSDTNNPQLSYGSENEDRPDTATDGVEQSNITTVNLWNYYEVRFDEDKERKVVDLMIFTDTFRKKDSEGGEDVTTQEIVAYYSAYYDTPAEWMHLIVDDAAIGGQKKFATAKGTAEITYNSDADSEELLNRLYSGEKMRAIPRFQRSQDVDEDQLLGWDAEDSSLVPHGVSEFRLQGSTGGLREPLALMRQNAASISGASHSNSGRDGELRTQSLERQSQQQANRSVTEGDILKSLEVICREIVRRFFVAEVEVGSAGYEEIMWFRYFMEREGIDLDSLSETQFGFFVNIEVKVSRSSSSGAIDHDFAAAQSLMNNLDRLPAPMRNLIIKRYVSLVTNDPQFSDDLIELAPRIEAAQRVTAESEFGTIERDAALGVPTPTNLEDEHVSHARTHNKHLAYLISLSATRPWTRADAVTFAGVQVHQQQHIDEVLLNPASRADGEVLLREFEELVRQGEQLLRQVEQTELEQQGVDVAQMEVQLKLAEEQRKSRELELKEADTISIIGQREARQSDIRRQNDQRFLLERAKLAQPTKQ